jgi:hypothetical protein
MEQPLNHLRRRLPRIAGVLLLAAVLGAVFMAYLRPSFVVDLANRIILCM